MKEQNTYIPVGKGSAHTMLASRDFDTRRDLMTTPEAAAYCHMSERFLEKRRVLGGGPAYLKLSRKVVLYDRRDLDQWLDAHRVRSTSEAA